MKSLFAKSIFLLLVLTLLELLAFLLVKEHDFIAALLFVFSGLGIGVLLLISQSGYIVQLPRNKNWAMLLVLGIVGFSLLNWLLNIFRINYGDVQIQMETADMLPMIEIMCKRFLNGEEVYARVPEIYNANPPYLPAMWMPFALPLFWDVDMRWAAIACLILALLVPILFVIKSGSSLVHKLAMFILIAAFNQVIIGDRFLYVTQTEEAVVLFYYTILALSIFLWRPYYIGVAMAFCLLSRYMLLFWFAAFCIALLLHKEHRQFAVKMIAASVITGVILLAASDSLNKIPYFMKLPGDYLTVFEKRAANKETYSLLLKNTIGLRQLFIDVPFRIYLNVVLLINLLLPGFLFFVKRNRLANKWVVLGIAKICLTVFLATIIHPFEYLFYTNVLFSFVILVSRMAVERKEVPPGFGS